MMPFIHWICPYANATGDNYISEISMQEEQVVISKDSDFYNDYFIRGQPYKLIFVITGNIKNSALLNLFNNNLAMIATLLNHSSVLELSNQNIVIVV
jgi:predicted nuclease of predicted toxin-antitoxin system